MDWREEELRILVRFVFEEHIAAQISYSLILAENIYRSGVSIEAGWPLLIIILTQWVVSTLKKTKSSEKRMYSIIGWCVLGHITALLSALTAHSESIIPLMVLTTVMLMTLEMIPQLSMAFSISAMCAHIAVWQALGVYLNIGQAFHTWSLLPSIWAIVRLTRFLMARNELFSKAICIETRRNEQAKLVSLVLAIPDGVVVVTEDCKIAAYNHMFLEQMGLSPTISYTDLYTRVSLLKYDQSFMEMCSSTLAEDIQDYIKSGSNAIINFKPVVVNGRHLEWRGKLGQWDNKLVCIATVRDSTQWVELEHTAKQESLQKSALLRSVSHELRTPANALINQALELHEHASIDTKPQTEIVVSSAKLLLSMIGDLLDFSQMNYGMLKLMKEKFNLKTALEDCYNLIKPQCELKNVGFKFIYDSFLPDVVFTDESRLKQVILHLLSNAVK